MAKYKRKHRCLLMMAIILVMLMSGCGTTTQYESSAQRIPAEDVAEERIDDTYETVRVYEDSFRIEFQTEATVEYTLSRELYWQETGDTYGQLLVSKGDIVKKGDVLATFYGSEDDELEVLEASIAVQEAQNSLNQTRQTYDELISAKQKSIANLSGEEYEIACLELSEMELEYEKRVLDGQYRITTMQKNLSRIQEEKGNKELVAPYDGKISMVSRSFKEGTFVDAQTPIVEIYDLDSRVLALKGGSFTSEVNYLSQVELSDPETQEKYTGTIVSCPQVTGSSGSKVIVRMNDEFPDGKDEIDFQVKGVLIDEKKATLVESRAIQSGANRNYVYVMGENHAKYKVYVTVAKSHNNITWISEGIVPGQIVLVGEK